MPARPAALDLRRDPEEWARSLGVSREAIDVYAGSDVLDLHVESFLWTRMAGYDLHRRHGTGLLDARFYSQVDLPRMETAGMTGSVFSIATQPLRPRSQRTATLLKNVARLRAVLDAYPGARVVSSHAEYLRARAEGRMGCFLAIQGGNALDSAPDDVERAPEEITRITLVHLSNSTLGSTSSPLKLREGGLTAFGRDYVRRMNARRILVDLAHINERGFWDAVEIHDREQPLIVSHTGVRGVHDMWRNIDDRQLRAVADRGGVVGIIFHPGFLGPGREGNSARAIVRHMEHVVRVAGEDFVALGSDWDGMISTPRDMKTVTELPVLVQHMLDAGFGAERIRKILGGNYLRVMKAVRPG